VSADDVVDRPRGCSGQLDPLDALNKRLQHGLGFESGQTLPGARVCAVAESELTGGVAPDVEGFR
jgi:hypothetical protein